MKDDSDKERKKKSNIYNRRKRKRLQISKGSNELNEYETKSGSLHSIFF